MDESGLDLRTWLTILGVFALFFGVPGVMLERDRRKASRAKASDRSPAETDAKRGMSG